MKLKRLILHGFKSFKDRTTIHFDEGITGIVGPNGCGKSNVVDALFWVMGEQSAKHLRGASMKDVIFSGSAKYSPGAFAEVSLVLENDGGKHIHIGQQVSSPTEIQLTRKLYRNGETEYRINDIPCRLRDIQEVFMDTGAGAKSYSIIAQGEIHRLVNQKPDERRVMIEEVAGITKFKVRKKESLKKIEATEQNLARLKDLQQEIEKNLKALERQAEKAERAKELKEKVKRYDLIVNSHKEFELLKNFKESNSTLIFKAQEIEQWSLRKNTLEIDLEEERFRKDEETSKIEELQKEYNDISRVLAASEERLNSLKKNRVEKEKLIETREKEKAEIEFELENRNLKLSELKDQLDDWIKKGQEEHDFSALEEKVEVLKEELELKNQSFNDLKDQIDADKEALNKIDQDFYRNTSRLEEYAATLSDLTKEIEALEAQYSGVSTQINDEREAVHAADKLASELKTEEADLKMKIDELSTVVRNNENELKDLSKSLIQTDSRLNSLVEINKSLAGKQEGVAEFLKDNSDSFGLLGTLLQCSEENTKAVQMLLKEFTETIVATKGDDKDVFAWLKSNEKSLEFLKISQFDKISQETIERLNISLGTELIALNDVLDLKDTDKSYFAPFFEGYFIANELTIEAAEALSTDIRFKAVAAKNGTVKVQNIGGAKLVSIVDVNTANDSLGGIVARNNQIDELTHKLAELQTVFANKEEQFQLLKDELDAKRIAHDDLRNKAGDAKANHASKKSALDAKLSSFETGFARLDILKNRKNEISKSRLELIENDEKLNKKKVELQNNLADSLERFEELKDQVEIQKSQYDEEKEFLLTKQVEAKSYEATVKGLTNQIEDIEAQLEKMNLRLENTTQLVDQYNTEIDQIIEEHSNLETSNYDVAQELSDKEDVLNLLKDSLGQLLHSMKEREDEVKELTSKINKNQREITEAEVKNSQYLIEEEQVVRNIFEKYQIDLRQVLGKFLEFSPENYQDLKDVNSMYWMETENGPQEIDKQSYEFVRRYGQDLKECDAKLKNYRLEFSRLGDINWQAIEDYDRQKHRADFLKVQEEELRLSLEDLQKAIQHIDEKSKIRFQAAYDEVNTRFSKVFPIIFGGGSAELKLVGDLNDAECGIEIVAQPPGKKMQNINLMSGGEKAMTAVSLIFSIFLVKPAPFCLLDEVDAPLDDANVGRFNELLREMSEDSQFILITHNKKTMELNDTLYGVTMQEPGVSKAVSVQLH